jgi:8-oxo-dGTP pyrophosphatase MutT (NUDIX family)
MKNNNKKQEMLIGGAIIFRDNRGKVQFLLVKHNDSEDWEIPKVTVRRGESSVRSVIRLTGEQGGMTAKVLEEAGRSSGNAIVNGKAVSQKYYYYLMMQKAGTAELMGFDQNKWLEYGDATKKLALKREKDMLKGAKDVLKEWEKTHSKKTVEFA